MNTIAIWLPNWIGDVVMATPAIRALRETYPDASLIAVSRPYVAETLAGSPWFDDVILWDKRPKAGVLSSWGLVHRLRQSRIDAAVLFPNSFRTAMQAMLGGCRRRVGFARYGRNLLVTDRMYYQRDHRGRFKPSPMIDDYNRLAVVLGAKPDYRLELFTRPEDRAAAETVWNRLNLSRFREVVALNTGGAFGASKSWPAEYFVELARRISDERKAGVLMLCGPAERETAREIARLADRPSVVSLADESLSLGLTKACIERANLLITTDSGPRHFAAAFGRPVVTLFGPTHIQWTETYYQQAIHLQKPVPCGPCQLRICPLDHRCMKELGVAEVWAAGRDLLDRVADVRRLSYVG